ncbi:MAG: hypothetical protein IJ860_00435 [Eubacterium sp.]|nr:hypothetical protein [Eubacterium sp.]
MNSMFGFLDIIILLCGVYMIYGAFSLKNGGDLPQTFWNKDYPIPKCKDRAGFAAFMVPRLIGCGAVIVLDGVLGLIGDRYTDLSFLSFITMGLVIAILVWYVIFTRKAQRLFF